MNGLLLNQKIVEALASMLNEIDGFDELFRSILVDAGNQPNQSVDAVLEMSSMCQEQQWEFRVWDVCHGIRNGGESTDGNEATDPLSVLKSFGTTSSSELPSILVPKNFHRFLSSAEIVQTMAEQIQRGKHQRNFLVVLSPKTEIPVELEKLFVVLEHRLPSKDKLEEIARSIATEGNELPEEAELSRVLDAASGLTRYAAAGITDPSLFSWGGHA